MSVQQFCLRWNNHQPNFISVCSSLLNNGTLVDVTLAAEGRQLQAHKIVLSACSSYFQTLFTSNPCQHPIVILKDVPYEDLKTMVDFMYYGEVNVSQDQLPHILKTAEMLKIKGLAEMPTDPANLTKSESKLSNEATELIGSVNNINQGNACGTNGGSGGISSNISGSVSDSIWGSTESQFQQQHHHPQHQQQQHQQQHHHQQQQSSQTQTSQQQCLFRRTPSPHGVGPLSTTRKKRQRKSSFNGQLMEEDLKEVSGERCNSEDQHNSTLDAANSPTQAGLSQICQMSFNTNHGQLGGISSHSISPAKLKESHSPELEAPQDSGSLDDSHGNVAMQIKPEVDVRGSHQIPLDISGATTPSDHDAPNSQSTHSGDSGYPLEHFLMTPFRNAVSGSQESQFNTVHASARNIVERTIGVLKNTFRCLLSVRGLHYSPKKATQITGVCGALHNVNKAFKTEFPEEPIRLVESDEFNDSEHIYDSNATIAREIRINLMRTICNQ